MTLPQALEEHLAATRRPSVRVSIRTWLVLFGAWCEHHGLHHLAELTPAHLEAFHRDLLWQANSRGQLYSPNTVQAVLVRVRRFLAWAQEGGWVEPALANHLRVNAVHRVPARLLSAKELAALWAAPNRREPRGLRDALLLELVAATRIPLQECPRLTLGGLASWELEPRVSACLETYLARARSQLAGGTELLFGSRLGPGLTLTSLQQSVARLGRVARLPDRLSPRRLRQSYRALLERSAQARLPSLFN